MNTQDSPLYFNTLPAKNDLKGQLQGSVSFAQCSVMPSRASMLANDVQPRPVALRDTLVLFRPLDGVDHSPHGISFSVKLGSDELFKARMDIPERLAKVAQRVDPGDADMTYPTRYDHVIASQAAIDQIADDPSAQRLSALLGSHDTINVRLANHQWAAHFHLPAHTPAFHGKKIAFHSDAAYSAEIHSETDHVLLQTGESALFVNVKGRWASEHDIEYARLRYGADLWSAVIPWQHVRPGIALEITSHQTSLSGSYPNIDVGAPMELVLNTIDIGMLTPPQDVFIKDFTDDLQRQYFQMTPISRLVVNQYEPVHWTEICMPDGTLYRDRSPDTADVHNGNLRQRIGKELISLGINNASQGIHSSPGVGEDGLNRHYVVAQLTAHTSVGNYANGRVAHGLSGGGSIVTLYDCSGNEFSHELGHNYAMGHHPGGFEGSVHRSAQNINCGWGWDSDLNVFLPNFEKPRRGLSTCHDGKCQAPFHDHMFGRDTMSSGYPMHRATNQYTLCTPYTLHHSQRFLEGLAIRDRQSPTGYVKWNEASGVMDHWGELYSTRQNERDAASIAALFNHYRLVEVDQYDGNSAKEVSLPLASPANRGKGAYILHHASTPATLRVNGTSVALVKTTLLRYESNGSTWQQVEGFSFPVLRRPFELGVPVTTLLGYYDPEQEKGAYIYPALHCAYGTTFETERAVELDHARNYLRVYGWGGTARFALGDRLGAPGMMNRFHVNLPQSFRATRVEVHMGEQVVSRDIDLPRGGTRVTITGQRG